MLHFKLQLGCVLIIIFLIIVYYIDSKRFGQWKGATLYNLLVRIGLLSVIFDGMTAYTVNHIEEVGAICNMILHMLFLLSLDCFIFLVYIYMLSITDSIPKSRGKQYAIFLPFMINIILVIVNIPWLEYRKGEISNYSMGISAYTCFAMIIIYILLCLFNFFKRWVYIEKDKRASVITYLLIMVAVTIYQMIFPEVLLSSICVTIIIVGIYIMQENPSIKQLTQYHEEMIMGFATLVENKDGSTGGHIRRTSIYVKLLVEELRRRGYYKSILTKEYINNLYMAAPMHDIGKIAIPDVILQKPGKLTEEEFAHMKKHAESGGKIIQETFGHLGNEEYTQMAYEVAKYHHEKWNGKGYPEGLEKENIPLAARIMAIADVFDAVSEKRCYRDAMSMDQCFEIIENGSGRDFDPMLAEIFLSMRDKIEAVHRENTRNS